MEREPLQDVQAQWAKNQARWAKYERSPASHLLILTEEVGEISRAMQTSIGGSYQWPPAYSPWAYEEIIDAAAVLLAMAFDCLEVVEG